LRVAFDISSTRGAKTGIGVYTENLIRALRQFTPHIEIIELDAPAQTRTPLRIWREQMILPRRAAYARADILHLTGFAAPLRARVPVVLTVHDLIGALFPENFPPVARFYWSRYLPFTLRFATRLVADSENTKRDLARLARGLDARVIYPGRDACFQPMAVRAAMETIPVRLPPNFFLFVGTLEPRKGVDTLIAAFAQVAREIPYDLVLVGKRGWAWQKLFAPIERAGLRARVHWLDYLPADQMPALYNLARALVFPSRYEGFGLPVLEAMACGTPVICSNAASVPEVAGNAALLIAPQDVSGFANAMQRVAVDDGLYAQLRARGLQQATRFSWERAARKMVHVYQEILK